MPKRAIGRIVLGLLLIGLFASWVLTVKTEREKRQLAHELEQTKAAVDELEQERARLSGDLADVNQTVKGKDVQLASLREELTGLKGQLYNAEQEIARLQTEAGGMVLHQASLTEQLEVANHDKAELQAKLSSLKELHAAIRTVKHQLREQRRQVWLAKIEAQRAADRQRLAEGNQGFVVRNGVSTLASTPKLGTKLQVRVLEPSTE